MASYTTLSTTLISTTWNGSSFDATLNVTVPAGTDFLCLRLDSSARAWPTTLEGNGVPITKLIQQADGDADWAAIGYFSSPASGSYDIYINTAGTGRSLKIVADAVSDVSGVGDSQSAGGFASSSSLTMVNAADDLILDVLVPLTDAAADASQTVDVLNEDNLSASSKVATSANETMSWTHSGDFRAHLAVVWTNDVPSGPALDPAPTTAFPGQSRTVTGTGFGATQGTGGLTIGGVAQTVASWSDTSITFTTVLGTNNYGTGKTLEVTTDAAETVSDTIELVADTAGGFGYVTMSSPNTTDESSVAFNTTPTVVTGDQFEWEDFNNLGNLTVDDQGFVSNVDTEGTFRGRFWDATDSTWGAVETFTASVPGEEDTWPFGKGINPAATKNWTWGRRHPKTNMRVRVYK